MICKELNKEFNDKELLFRALKENKEALIAQKKMQTKQADSWFFVANSESDDINKNNSINSKEANVLKSSLVINTTNVIDSHNDVHLKGIWNKSVKEQKNLYLLQEHKMNFDSIISNKVKASVKEFTFKQLGADLEGKTEALVFDAEISKSTNEKMFQRYAEGVVKNHSVGMRYVKIDLAMNSDSKYDVEEKEIWDKYIGEVANRQQAEDNGYFWAVSEAKIIEGSAVLIGSNTITPTLNVESKNEAASSTSKQDIEPSSKDTQIKNNSINFKKFI